MKKKPKPKKKAVVIESGGSIPPGRYVDGFSLIRPRPEITSAVIRLSDGRVLRKEPGDMLWHLYAGEQAAGYRRMQQGDVRFMLEGLI